MFGRSKACRSSGSLSHHGSTVQGSVPPHRFHSGSYWVLQCSSWWRSKVVHFQTNWRNLLLLGLSHSSKNAHDLVLKIKNVLHSMSQIWIKFKLTHRIPGQFFRVNHFQHGIRRWPDAFRGIDKSHGPCTSWPAQNNIRIHYVELRNYLEEVSNVVALGPKSNHGPVFNDIVDSIAWGDAPLASRHCITINILKLYT